MPLTTTRGDCIHAGVYVAVLLLLLLLLAAVVVVVLLLLLLLLLLFLCVHVRPCCRAGTW
jgi:hypothetical protein